MTENLFTFETGVYRDDTEPVFELRMRYKGRIVWSDKTPVDFGAQNTDDPYEPSSPLTADDLTWALRRDGWRVSGEWTEHADDPGYLSAAITPTEWAVPHITLPPTAFLGLEIA